MAAPNFTQSRPVTATQYTFQAGDKTAAQAGKVVYTNGAHLIYDKPNNRFFIIMTLNGSATVIYENYWVVKDNATGSYQIWDPTTFSANHV